MAVARPKAHTLGSPTSDETAHKCTQSKQPLENEDLVTHIIGQFEIAPGDVIIASYQPSNARHSLIVHLLPPRSSPCCGALRSVPALSRSFSFRFAQFLSVLARPSGGVAK